MEKVWEKVWIPSYISSVTSYQYWDLFFFLIFKHFYIYFVLRSCNIFSIKTNGRAGEGKKPQNISENHKAKATVWLSLASVQILHLNYAQWQHTISIYALLFRRLLMELTISRPNWTLVTLKNLFRKGLQNNCCFTLLSMCYLECYFET